MRKGLLLLFLLFLIPLKAYGLECFPFLRVIDGDTIKILYHVRKTSVRLLGIDTPESRRNRRAYMQARHENKDVRIIVNLGKRAKKHLELLLKRYHKVCLEYDRNNIVRGHRDRYGRILAYVYTPDGLFINEKMLRDGYAYLLTGYPLEPRYEKILREAFREAIRNKRGLWN